MRTSALVPGLRPEWCSTLLARGREMGFLIDHLKGENAIVTCCNEECLLSHTRLYPTHPSHPTHDFVVDLFVNSVEVWLKSLKISRATHCLRFAMPMVFIVGNMCFVNCFIDQRYFLQKIDLKLQIHEKERNNVYRY